MYECDNGVFSLKNYFKEQVYILFEALTVFLNPPPENLTNVLSNKINILRVSGSIQATSLLINPYKPSVLFVGHR